MDASDGIVDVRRVLVIGGGYGFMIMTRGMVDLLVSLFVTHQVHVPSVVTDTALVG